ncbi:MAG: TolC family protein [Candidatus Dadabacteria bacterium]|nr:TolC family protein [Candidatus Dadabacteria bacterium]MCZ6790670.1 TolC family protein [Candidatus Dadabacteria bacterium]
MKLFQIIFFAIFLLGINTRAEKPIQTLTIDQAVDIAIRENRDLIAARIQIEEARGRLKQAGLYPNPELESDFGIDTIFANDGERSFSVGINQPIPLSGRIGAQKKVASVDIKRTHADLTNIQRILARDVRLSFIELLTIEKQLKLQETLINLNSELLKGIDMGIKEGLASQQDLNAVAIALQQARQEKEVLIAQRKSNILKINNLLGKQPTFNFIPQGELAYEAVNDLNNYNIETAFAQRPDLKFAKLDVELAEADLKLAKALRFEDIKAGVFYGNDRLVLDSPVGRLTDSDQLIGFKVTVPLPIFDRKQGLVAEAQAREKRAEENVEALKLTISQEVSDALNRVTTLSDLLETYQTGILKTAEDNVILVEDGFKQGLVAIVDVIQSRQQFAALTSSYINTVRNYYVSLNDLQISTGKYQTSIISNKSKESEINVDGQK